jgi:hypothetical protein
LPISLICLPNRPNVLLPVKNEFWIDTLINITDVTMYTARILNLQPNMDRDWHTQAEQAYRDWRSDAAHRGFFDDERVRRLAAEFPADWRR